MMKSIFVKGQKYPWNADQNPVLASKIASKKSEKHLH
jgi:hypothetical protein